MSLEYSDFDDLFIDVGEVVIRARTAGSGPPILLLHGYPESSLMWRHVAPALAADFTVVVTDLRGYGSSSAPADSDDHAIYGKRAMAEDQARVMTALGHNSFGVAGHDRGGRVAHRLALDHPARVQRICVLDIVPTLHMFENVDRAMAQSYFHWFFLTQPDGLPEALINADPDAWVTSRFRGRHSGSGELNPDVISEYADYFRDPERVAATCADYRAAASIDLIHDRTDRAAGRRVTSPLLAFWGEDSYVGRNFEVVDVWGNYADVVSGIEAPSDHFIPEELPALTASVLGDFFREGET